ncbi:hypothetical protein [Methyloprofundus sp.]|uniref:hypothetical protein n=1 Tax=Methyloprofundus sp. TaxID=2020875 RepID=UPI003D1206D0
MDAKNPMKKNIKKIVYVMFENRSFDTMLGWLYDGASNPKVNNIPPDPEVTFQGLTAELQKTFAQPIKYKIESWENGTKDIVRGVQGNHFPCFTPLVDPEETFCNINYQIYKNKQGTGDPTHG